MGPTAVIPATSCVPGSSGSISLPNLAPIQSQELETHVIAVTPEDQSERDGESGGFFGQREQDRKVRREIANSNERRRMQSINAGFKSLKTILPHADGDKLSKAAILQQTAEYIFQLESDKLKLLDQNEKLRRSCAECSSPKHRAFLTDISEKDEGIGSPREEDLEDLRRDTIEVRQQLDKERRLRMVLEEKVRELEAKVYPEKLRELANSIAAQYKQNHPKQDDATTHRPTLPVTASDVQCVQVFDVAAYGKPTTVPATTCAQPQPSEQISNNSHAQKVLYPMATVSAGPAVHLSPVQTDTVPATVMSVSVPGTPEVEVKSPTLPTAKNQSAVPRSRQPLKKRAIEVSDIEPKPKVSKVTNLAHTFADPLSPPLSSPGEHQIGIVVPTASVITTNTSAPHPTHRQLAKKQQGSPLYSVHQTLFPHKIPEQVMQQQTIQLAIPENVKLEPVQPVPSPTHKYMTLSSIERLPQYAVQSVPQQQTATPTGLPTQLPGVIQSFRLAQNISAKPEEMTLNQLNSVPSLSMTLTQLNAVPNVTRSKATMMAPAAPQLAPRVQSQFLPLVTMDAILGRHTERRISTATTDSATSDEELPATKLPNPAVEHPEPACKVAVRTSSTNSDSPKTEVISPNSSVAAATTLSVLSSGPGSPPVMRHIDAVTTRRNLETIVQAIDHLEQQERRNSQDNPACVEENSAPR
uniref:AP4 transcription factor n=1 Tax=Phallusia mammillata TaxID=59560 RepID=A0A6F9DV60_9ASCI|nr:AP4 transcription factor [Phallusia mammillata]